MLGFLIYINLFSLFLVGCQSNNANHNSNKTKIEITNLNIDFAKKQSKTYTMAIQDFMKVLYEKDKSTFDTIYFSSNEYFPVTDFPTIVDSTKIILLPSEEIDKHKVNFKKSTPFINLIFFVENNSAEFIFITFFPEFNHKYDCYLNYNYLADKNEFQLDKSRLEVFVPKTDLEAAHFEVFEGGKYTGIKLIGNKK